MNLRARQDCLKAYSRKLKRNQREEELRLKEAAFNAKLSVLKKLIFISFVALLGYCGYKVIVYIKALIL